MVSDAVINDFKTNHILSFDINFIDEHAEDILINGNDCFVEIDINGYNEILSKDNYTYEKLAEIGMKLHKELKDIEGKSIPKYIFYEKEMWAYLSITAFADIVKRLRLDDDKINENKISQFYFNNGSVSRTGLMFIWVMIDRLNSENNAEMSLTAFEFIDPVKAIFERTMSKNPIVLQAFVQGIINNNKNPKFKREGYRVKIPNHISCYAAVNYLDDYSYNELVMLITEQQKMLLK